MQHLNNKTRWSGNIRKNHGPWWLITKWILIACISNKKTIEIIIIIILLQPQWISIWSDGDFSSISPLGSWTIEYNFLANSQTWPLPVKRISWLNIRQSFRGLFFHGKLAECWWQDDWPYALQQNARISLNDQFIASPLFISDIIWTFVFVRVCV